MALLLNKGFIAIFGLLFMLGVVYLLFFDCRLRGESESSTSNSYCCCSCLSYSCCCFCPFFMFPVVVLLCSCCRRRCRKCCWGRSRGCCLSADDGDAQVGLRSLARTKTVAHYWAQRSTKQCSESPTCASSPDNLPSSMVNVVIVIVDRAPPAADAEHDSSLARTTPFSKANKSRI